MLSCVCGRLLTKKGVIKVAYAVRAKQRRSETKDPGHLRSALLGLPYLLWTVTSAPGAEMH